jgi:hypothetical protein
MIMMKTLLSECFWKHRTASIAILLILGGTLLTFWPGILMSDTSARWAAVLTMKGVLAVGWSLEQWLAPTMTIFMLPFGFTEQSIPLFTAVQVVYLSLAGLMWISLTSSERPIWVPLLFAMPVMYLYAAFIVPDVWTLAAMIVVTAILTSSKQRLGIFSLLLFFVSNIVLFGFRQNSMALLPFVAFLVIKRASAGRWERHILLSLLALAVFFIAMVPQRIGFGARTSSAAAPAWELVGMLRIAKESNLPVDPSVTLEGIADTNAAIKTHSFTTIDSLLWGERAAVSNSVILHHSDEIKSRWFRAIRTYPTLYFLMKMRVYKCMLGLCDQYFQTNDTPLEPPPFLEGHVRAYADKGGFGGAILRMNAFLAQRAGLVYRPIFWIPLGCLVFLLQWRRYSAFDRLLIGGATIYMLSFFLLNQAASFRYMFPAYAVYTAYQIRFLGWVSCFLLNKLKPGQREPRKSLQ